MTRNRVELQQAAAAKCAGCPHNDGLTAGSVVCAKAGKRLALSSAICPDGQWDHHIEPARTARGRSRSRRRMGFKGGPEKWGELHRRAIAFAGDAAAERQWLDAFTASLPMKGCTCRDDWRAIVTEFPPAFEDAERYFGWTVDRHNDVNRRLGKTEMSVEAARARWMPVG